MKIKSLHISAFGGIKNLDLNLENSFNIIYGDNENGKTTIMNFIKMMFYGTERSGAQLNKNLRKKYTPWDNSIMAGSIVFENNGRAYRLERVFANSNSTDKITLFDLALGTSETVSADIGTKLFGLSLPAFERSIFIGQFGFPDANDLASGELNGKLSNIVSTGDETISFDRVQKRLETAKFELMSKSGRSGLYDKSLKQIGVLEKELQKSQETEEIVKKAHAKLDEINTKIKATAQRAELLKAQIDSENDIRNSEKMRELLALKAELDELNKSLTLQDGKLADEMFVRKVEFCLSKIDNIQSKITSKQNEKRITENNLNLALNVGGNTSPETEKALTEKIAKLENEKISYGEQIARLEAQTPKKNHIIWLVLAVLFALLGCGGYFINKFVGLGGLAAAVIFMCVALLTRSKNKSLLAKTQAKILDLKLMQNQVITLIATETANLNAISVALNTNSTMIEKQTETLKELSHEIEGYKTELDSENQTLFSLFSAFKPTEDLNEITVLLHEIKQSAKVQKELKQNINYILKDVGNISYEEIKAKLSATESAESIDFDKVKSEYDTLLQALTDYKTTAATISAEVKSLVSNAKNPENIKSELKTLKTKTASQKEYCDCLDIALSVLADSYAEVRQSYGSALEKNAGEIFASLTGGNYRNMSISKSFDITVEKTDIFGSHELDYLSSGTADQAYLSLRLALSELISQESEGLPIILDDALAQYDDTRTMTALKFLKEYSQKGQIILFTCHKAITDMAQNFQPNQITL